MEREVHYCTSEDGVRIAYCVEGEGPPLLFCHHVWSFSMSHLVPTFDEAIRRIGLGRQLIRYDIRGTGLSHRDVGDLSPAALLRDVEAVVRALGLKHFTLLGAAVGGPRAIEYAARHSDQVEGLVLYATCARIADVWPRAVLDVFAQLARASWELATRTIVDTAIRRQDEREGLRWAELLRRSVSGDNMARLIETHSDLDVMPLLSRVQCPTVVCHSINDAEYPFSLGQRLAEGIPNARLVPLEGGERGPFTSGQGVVDAMARYLPHAATATPSPPPDSEAAALTPRETEVLRLIAAGRTNREIAADLVLSLRRVARHVTNIYGKIGARGKAEATAYAIRHGLTQD